MVNMKSVLFDMQRLKFASRWFERHFEVVFCCISYAGRSLETSFGYKSFHDVIVGELLYSFLDTKVCGFSLTAGNQFAVTPFATDTVQKVKGR